ncbi:MAG: hypothetical protein ACK529_06060 [Alphaproteobacteria bacterium]|jgi:hypothetical protein
MKTETTIRLYAKAARIAAPVSIGWIRDDGDLHVFATLNNNDEFMDYDEYSNLIQCTFDVINDYFRKKGIYIDVFERQDAPDYVDLDAEEKSITEQFNQ